MVKLDEISVTCFPRFSSIKKTEVSKLVCGFQIKTSPVDEKLREPIEICIVLDKSGSMNSNNKLKWSKRGIRKIIKHLEPTDSLHLVTYDTSVETVFVNGDLSKKDDLITMVKKIETGSSTNIYGGIERAFSILKLSKKTLMKKIYFFSDGLANEGIKSPEEIFKLCEKCVEDKISISSFGVGSDFDEKMMRGIAEHGKGRYFFLDQEESITKKISKAIHGTLNIIGTMGKLSIVPKNNTKIVQIFGRESMTDYEFGDIFGENTKNVLVEVQVTPPSFDTDIMEVFDYVFNYNSIKGGGLVSVQGSLKISLTDSSPSMESQSAFVAVLLAVQEAAIKNKEIAVLVEKNNIKDAIKMKKELVEDMEKNYLKIDETKKVAKIIEKSKKELVELEKKDVDHATVSKELYYESYKMREASDDEFNQSGSDSDKDNYSDNEQSNQQISPPFYKRRKGGKGKESDESDSEEEDFMGTTPPQDTKDKKKGCLLQ